MTLAGKYGMGVLSIASQLHRGHLGVADTVGLRRAGRHRARPGRRPAELASDDGVPPRRVEGAGPQRSCRRPAAAGTTSTTSTRSDGPARRTSRTSGSCSTSRPAPVRRRGAAVIGTPDELVAAIRHLQDLTGGSVWSSASPTTGPTARRRCAVGPHDALRDPRDQRIDHLDSRIAGVPARQPGRTHGRGVEGRRLSKILAHEGAAAALATTMAQAAQAAADEDAPKQSEFRPGAGIPTAD